MLANAIPIAAVMAAVIGPLGAYLVAARRLSGKIETSEASDLWEASTTLRTDLMARIDVLNDIIAGCERRVSELEQRNDSLFVENAKLRQTMDEMNRTISDLRVEVKRLDTDNGRLRRENNTLRARVEELEGQVGH